MTQLLNERTHASIVNLTNVFFITDHYILSQYTMEQAIPYYSHGDNHVQAVPEQLSLQQLSQYLLATREQIAK
ncbi:hypothetical protein C442_02981 [Haloarcula amylolytica JCM 13557]|uniref:Uncharacterized protein n=1 Tax=Haloarcula amylolytica JCM 13557 TaxID=1227452 RepID=M0KWZ9_9EURY|nr:hypothetical protein C442_02981 [Haloarcula amylolytica JCM 13557]